jgi:hypothetical protein
MRIRDVDNQHTIKTSPSPKDRLEYYLGRTGTKSLENLTFEQRKNIFLLVIKDFMEGTFSVDALSSFSFDLHDYKLDLNTATPEEKELYTCTESGSELSFYVRKFPNQFAQFMIEVKDYFDKYFPF